MALTYSSDLNALVRDLETRGFQVERADRIDAEPNGAADVHLTNGVTVRLDSPSRSLWATGPILAVRKVEYRLADRGLAGALRRVFQRDQDVPLARTAQPIAGGAAARV